MAYSSGFNPHPRISYANAAPTGAASEAEYVELGLSQVCDPDKVREALNEVLPAGFEIVALAEAKPASLTDLLQASDWEMQLPDAGADELKRAAEQLMATEEFMVERMTKTGMRTFDVRAALLGLAVEADRVGLRVVHQTPLVRPDDVRSALRAIAPGIPDTPPVLRRIRQGPLDGGQIRDPLD